MLSIYHKQCWKIDNIETVKDYPDVFPDELLGLPRDWQIEFDIYIIPEAYPVVHVPCRLAPSKMQELRKKLQELIDWVK